MASIIIITVFSTLIGGGIAAKASKTTGIFLMDRFKRKLKKKKITKNLHESISNLNFNNFINSIQEMKNYDEYYGKNLFIKNKQRFVFTDKHADSLISFKQRFDNSFSQEQEYLIKMVRDQIEISINLMNKHRLNL